MKMRRTRRQYKHRGGNLKEAYVITLDTDSNRFKHARDSLAASGIHVTPYDAVDGAKLNLETLPTLGIGRALFQSRKVGGKPHNLGAVGCFLSHRNLYKKILEKPRGSEAKYLIFEDDAVAPPNFVSELEKRLKRIPDWDIVYMSKMDPYGEHLGEGLIRLKRDPTATKNIGTWAYIIKEKCVRRLYALLTQMTDQIDAQINQEFDTMKAYCFEGAFIETAGASTIDAMDS